MKNNKIIKLVVKIMLFVVVVIAIDRMVYYSVEWYRSLPMDCEYIETLDKFVFFVSPKTSDEETGLSSGQLCVARIRTDDLAGQSCEDVLKNKCGPIEIVLAQFDSDFDAYNYNTDLSLYQLQSANDLKIKRKKKRGYIQGEDIFPELNQPLGFSLDALSISFPDEDEQYGYAAYLVFYNDKFIRFCRDDIQDGVKMNLDFIYTVENDNINIIRNICQIYHNE